MANKHHKPKQLLSIIFPKPIQFYTRSINKITTQSLINQGYYIPISIIEYLSCHILSLSFLKHNSPTIHNILILTKVNVNDFKYTLYIYFSFELDLFSQNHCFDLSLDFIESAYYDKSAFKFSSRSLVVYLLINLCWYRLYNLTNITKKRLENITLNTPL